MVSGRFRWASRPLWHHQHVARTNALARDLPDVIGPLLKGDPYRLFEHCEIVKLVRHSAWRVVKYGIEYRRARVLIFGKPSRQLLPLIVDADVFRAASFIPRDIAFETVPRRDVLRSVLLTPMR